MPTYSVLPQSELLLELSSERMKLGEGLVLNSQPCNKFQVLSSVFVHKEVPVAGKKGKQNFSTPSFLPSFPWIY